MTGGTIWPLSSASLAHCAPFLEMPEAFRQLLGHLLKRLGGDREMADIPSLVLRHDEHAVLQAGRRYVVIH